MEVGGYALSWFASFLTGRTEQVKVGDSLSQIFDVKSGVVQGSVCGPGLFSILADSLLRRIKSHSWAFADDIKFVADVTSNSRDVVQEDVNTVLQWSEEMHMPLSLDKSVVMHCGRNQPNFIYTLKGSPMPCVESFKDLGVVRSHNGHITEQCCAVYSKASRLAGAIRHIFQQRSPQLMWPAFQSYILPILMYCSQAWNPVLVYDSNLIEKVQRRYTKSIAGLRQLSYGDRLKSLSALSLRNRRLYADLVFAYKAVHGLFNCQASDFGLHMVTSSTRGSGTRLAQRRVKSRIFSGLYCVRAPSQWNKLPLDITNCRTLATFKKRIFKYLVSLQ